MENEDRGKKDPEQLDLTALSDADLIERVAKVAFPELTLSMLRNYSPEEWEKLELRIGTDGARALAAVLELGRRMEEEND
jgi:hypothetical protein